MHTLIKTIFGSGVILLLIATTACADRSPYSGYAPTRFSDDIQRFEQWDQRETPQEGAILFIGSSSIRLWADNLSDDMSPLPVMARGFGGSNMHDVNFFYDRIVAPYSPSAIVVYVGENDIVQGVSPAGFVEEYRAFVSRAQRDFPGINIYYLSIKPAPARRSAWPKMRAANDALRAYTETSEQLFFIDVATDMLDSKGNPRSEIHIADGIHMNRAGYAIWTSILKPVLLENESQE
ncbi:MAG: GDSL-type esterase/lipase family protein [Pseudomonadota bacterium]